MCSIIGYVGDGYAAPIIVRGLRRMEYRGYDSVGVATSSSSKITIRKGIGRVNQVNTKIGLDGMPGSAGIGHTRWATHGKVTESNAHPHPSNSGSIAIVHNGIVENFREVRGMLRDRGYKFCSDTDSEVIANLLQMNYEESSGDIRDAMLKTIGGLKGHYAFVAMFEDGSLAAARSHEPLIIGMADGGIFLSSDILGFIEYADDAIYLENGSFVVVDGGVRVFDFDGKQMRPATTKLSKEFGDAYKNDYAHFTLKEICEQSDTMLRSGLVSPDLIEQTASMIREARDVYLTGSGTSYHAAVIAKHLLARYAHVRSEAVLSSEFRMLEGGLKSGSAVMAFSQSGESSDVLGAVDIAREAGCKVISILNIPMSSLARESDAVIGINCGPEIGVAATKSFTSQLVVLYRIVREISKGVEIDLHGVAEAASEILDGHDSIREVAGRISKVSDIYVLGRGMHYPVAMEAALKLKELSYIHAEGIPGGEIKHGTLAMIDSGVVAIVVHPYDSTYQDTLINVEEIKARGAMVIGVSDVECDLYDHWIRIPKIREPLYPMLEIIPIQMLSYYVAIGRNTDPDHPRNLAKSVTVK